MRNEKESFGRAISLARRAKGMSQKELASAVKKDEGEGSISPQYLNDIEHDRRSPSSDFLVKQFATILELKTDYLYFLAGKFPEEFRKKSLTQDQVMNAMMAFRKTLK